MYDILHCRQRRTEPRLAGYMRRKFGDFGHVVFEIREQTC